MGKVRKSRPYSCKWCGCTFVRENKRKGYCSRSCGRQAALKEKRGGMPVPVSDGWISHLQWRARQQECSVCGMWSLRARCTRECEREHARRLALTPTRCVCKTCGKLFAREFYQHAQMCGECRRVVAVATRRRTKARHRKKYGTSNRKRARKFGVPYEPINRLRVYERDNWLCGICGKKTQPSRKAPHPRSPSLDHIVPMSKGGGHVLSNVQCACFECNWKKSDKFCGQLRLAMA
jgi:hypothetical protein